MTAALIAVGGALGSVLRYALAGALAQAFGTALAYGTLAANVLGSFALGLVVELLEGRSLLGVDLRLILGTGLMGGFTTYSSFNLETLRLVQAGELPRALGYMVGTLVLCLLVGWLGLVLCRALKS